MEKIQLPHTSAPTANFQQFFSTAFSVDNVIFGFDEGDLKVLLIKRGEERGSEIFKDRWALPGDLVNVEEDLDAAAYRVLEDLTSIKNVYLEQVHTFGAVGRHPAGRVITVAYYSLVKIDQFTVLPASFAQKATWHSVANVADLAFDHNLILDTCVAALRHRVRTRPIGFELLPRKFTLTALQHLYEAILGDKTEGGILDKGRLDKRNFRKKILAMHFIVDLNESQAGVAHRPARLYEFDEAKYQHFIAEGFNFEL
jgi:8-oxo-dGTP diphosphatase